MNEKLTVRNFGPIDYAEVEFKRVTVFIGPTGGGKSTLAKLAAVFRDRDFLLAESPEVDQRTYDESLHYFGISGFDRTDTVLSWVSSEVQVSVFGRTLYVEEIRSLSQEDREELKLVHLLKRRGLSEADALSEAEKKELGELLIASLSRVSLSAKAPETCYVPAERLFAAAISSGLAGLVLKGVALPKALLSFLNNFQLASQEEDFEVFDIPALGVRHRIVNGINKIELAEKKLVDLALSASGIQAVVPLMMVVEHRIHQEGKGRFIVEEPELNIFPDTQRKVLQDVMKWLGKESDLVTTTHSPYILSHLNLLLYAHQVAAEHPERADDVAKLVPRESWIDPTEFAAYYVGEGGVRSIVNADLGLIDDNELDGIAGDQADAFDNLIRLSKGFAVE